jgi:hypothetical protein
MKIFKNLFIEERCSFSANANSEGKNAWRENAIELE